MLQRNIRITYLDVNNLFEEIRAFFPKTPFALLDS